MEYEKKIFLSTGGDDPDDFYDELISYCPERKKNRWSVVWSDLMMIMFFFFTVMYVFQISTPKESQSMNKPAESGPGEVVNIGVDSNRPELYDQTRQAVSEVMVNDPNSVELKKDGTVRIVLAGDFLFDPGKADLKIAARFQLDQIARVLNENDFAINVVGHTDDSPTRADLYPTNWDLSSKRAIMVARYLTEVTKVDEKRIFVSAYSSFQPVASNDTARNRELNRRVEIILLKQKPYGQISR